MFVPSEHIQTILRNLPHKPGCYLMKDKSGTVIYVGKAIDLHNRVRSYFDNTVDHPKTLRLRHNFTREAIIDVHALRDYLGVRGLSAIPVYGAFMFTNPRSQVTTRQPVVPVAKLDTLRTVLQQDYFAKDRISADQIKQAVDAVYA